MADQMAPTSSAHGSVLEQLRSMILRGRWQAGEALPGERDLASELNCSRASLRESLRVLEAQGIIDSKPGGRSTIRSEARSAYGRVLELQLAIGQYSKIDLLHTRVAIEMWSTRRAAETRSEEHLATMRSFLTRMEDPSIPVREFNSLDAQFHSLITTAAGNAMVHDLNDGLRRAIEMQMIEAYDELEDWWGTTHSVRAEHWRILEALERRDPELAAALVRSHIMNFFRELIQDDGAERAHAQNS